MEEPTGKDSNIVIFCSDPRVVKWLNNPDIRKKLDLSDGFGAIAETGSIKFFLNENLLDKLYKQLDILVGHFSPEKIIILNHTDCGYYKSIGQDKKEIYLADLRTVGSLASDKYPKVKVESYLLDTERGQLQSV